MTPLRRHRLFSAPLDFPLSQNNGEVAQMADGHPVTEIGSGLEVWLLDKPDICALVKTETVAMEIEPRKSIALLLSRLWSCVSTP
jgi:hypothetical protein